jgi:uncharacterized protein (DUF362 family)
MPELLYDHRVAVVRDQLAAVYPQFPYRRTGSNAGRKSLDSAAAPNRVFDLVRQTFVDLRLDIEHMGSPSWNPLGSFIQPGQTVLLKPNWVHDRNPIDPNIDSLITHTSIISAVIEYVVLALHGQGTVIIADAPLQSCDFERLIAVSRAGELIESLGREHPGVSFQLVDLRKTVFKQRTTKETLRGESFQSTGAGAAAGYTLVKLDGQSLLTDLDDRFERFRVTNYDHQLMHEHHNREVNEYLIGNAVFQADVVINLPKMKTHIKAGLTGALKNLIGINGHKEFLPHHVNDSFLEGGDQYIFPSSRKRAYNRMYDRYWSRHQRQSRWVNAWQSIYLKVCGRFSRYLDGDDLFDGGWFGNETIPRTTIDLNHILYFFDAKQGRMQDVPVRKVFHLVDGIVAGEKNGPLQPTARPVGTLIAGFNPLLVDLAMAQLIGYQPRRIKTIFYGFYHKKSRLWNTVPDRPESLPVVYNGKCTPVGQLPNLGFALPLHWRALAATAPANDLAQPC